MREFFERAKEGQGEVHARDRDDLVLMTCLAMVDGSLSARELSVLKAIGKKTGIGEKDLREIIVGVEAGTLAPAQRGCRPGKPQADTGYFQILICPLSEDHLARMDKAIAGHLDDQGLS